MLNRLCCIDILRKRPANQLWMRTAWKFTELFRTAPHHVCQSIVDLNALLWIARRLCLPHIHFTHLFPKNHLACKDNWPVSTEKVEMPWQEVECLLASSDIIPKVLLHVAHKLVINAHPTNDHHCQHAVQCLPCAFAAKSIKLTKCFVYFAINSCACSC